MLARKLLRVKFYEYFEHLEDSAEKNRQVSTVSCQDNKLPSPRTEAKALLRMVGRNGNGLDSLESMRALIRVGETVKHMMFKNAHDKKEVRRMLLFRERVLEVFDQLVTKQEKALEELEAKQEKKRSRRNRFLAKRQRERVPADANLTGTTLNTITP